MIILLKNKLNRRDKMKTLVISNISESTIKPKISKSKSPDSDEPRNLLQLVSIEPNNKNFLTKIKMYQNSPVSVENQNSITYKRNCNNGIKDMHSDTVNSSAEEDTTETSSTLHSSAVGSPIISLLTLESPTEKSSEDTCKTMVKYALKNRGKHRHSEYFCKASFLAGPKWDQMPSINF